MDLQIAVVWADVIVEVVAIVSVTKIVLRVVDVATYWKRKKDLGMDD